MLINGMLFSASAWYPVTEQNLRTLALRKVPNRRGVWNNSGSRVEFHLNLNKHGGWNCSEG